jgi:hypothetical protein
MTVNATTGIKRRPNPLRDVFFVTKCHRIGDKGGCWSETVAYCSIASVIKGRSKSCWCLRSCLGNTYDGKSSSQRGDA